MYPNTHVLLFDIKMEKLASLAIVLADPADKIHKQLEHIYSDLGEVGGVIDSMVARTSVELSHLEVYEE